MTLEERKSNIYFDQTGKQILVGDLLKIFHFKSGRKKYYMYHHVVMEETDSFPVMAIQAYYAHKPHCRLYVLADNNQKVYRGAQIVCAECYTSKRLKIKLLDN